MKQIKLRFDNKNIRAKLLETEDELCKGLMLREGTVLMRLPKESRAYGAIHTFFCKPMIVAWIDSKLKITEVVQAKPWRIYVPKKPAAFIFESTNIKHKLKVGQKIKFEENI